VAYRGSMWVFLLRVRISIVCIPYGPLSPLPVKIWGLKIFDIIKNFWCREFSAQWTHTSVAVHYSVAVQSYFFDSERKFGLARRMFDLQPPKWPLFSVLRHLATSRGAAAAVTPTVVRPVVKGGNAYELEKLYGRDMKNKISTLGRTSAQMHWCCL